MQYMRKLTKSELTALGDNFEKILNNVIDETIRKLSDKNGAAARLITVLSDTHEMNVREILTAHNKLYPTVKLGSVGYVRFMLADMCTIGIIKRVTRGKYMK